MQIKVENIFNGITSKYQQGVNLFSWYYLPQSSSSEPSLQSISESQCHWREMHPPLWQRNSDEAHGRFSVGWRSKKV